jgi:hypothetical protein
VRGIVDRHHNHEVTEIPFVKVGTEKSADVETHCNDHGLYAPLRSGGWKP